MKPPEMLPPINDPIPNQDITRVITQQDIILPPLLAKWHTGYKLFFNDIKFQIKQKKKIIIIQIFHVLKTNIL